MEINRFREITKSYLRGSHIVVVLFDITNRESFDNIESNWTETIMTNSNINFSHFVLIGHKNDQTWKREVTFTEASMFAEKYNSSYFEVSSLDSGRVLHIVDTLLLRYFEDKSTYYKKQSEPSNKCIIQ